MKSFGKYFIAGLIGAFFLQGIESKAISVTVQEVGVDPYKVVNISVPDFYTGGAYAGVVKLKVNGVAMDGFCIDPFHFSSSSALVFDVVPLANAPKPFNGISRAMGTTGADTISKLWAMAYSSTMTAAQAAGLQIAIWKVVGGNQFSISGDDYGATTLLSQVQNYTGPVANLIGLTGPGQDYVVQNVPETGATIILLALGMLGLGIVRKAGKFETAAK